LRWIESIQPADMLGSLVNRGRHDRLVGSPVPRISPDFEEHPSGVGFPEQRVLKLDRCQRLWADTKRMTLGLRLAAADHPRFGEKDWSRGQRLESIEVEINQVAGNTAQPQTDIRVLGKLVGRELPRRVIPALVDRPFRL
jgi:hypothetical protein